MRADGYRLPVATYRVGNREIYRAALFSARPFDKKPAKKQLNSFDT